MLKPTLNHAKGFERLMQADEFLPKNVIALPRGGYLVNTSRGFIQVGCPPETIKDTMLLPSSVPQIFVLASRLFSPTKGISLAELEFPIYFNFFLQKRKTLIVALPEQAERLEQVLKESIYGPAEIDINQDISQVSPPLAVPNLKAEMAYYRNFTLAEMFSFVYFEDDVATIGELKIIREDGAYLFIDQGKEIGHIKSDIEYRVHFDLGERLKNPYRPPLFAITCLGPSHGFDPTENTSGFIIWCNHHGIMVDPPVNSTEWLKKSNVNPKLIDSIILTHCHADHDAGTFQKIMEEGRITIYTTQTIMKSFLRKYSALCGEDEKFLQRLFDFQPVYLQKPFFIHGAEFRAFYSLHSIPTLGFTMQLNGKTFVYSSDHQADPKVHAELYQNGILDHDRYQKLTNFPWHSNLIYHEAGIPPLHTPINWLNSLPKDIQKKIYVYHIAKKDFPAKTSLRLCKFGMEHTVNISVPPPSFEEAYEVLSILKHLDFFHNFPIQKVQEFLLAIEREVFKKGDYIIHRGKHGTKFYIIYSGNVVVSLSGLATKKIYSEFEYFGEVALLNNQFTTADVVAETEVIAYSLSRDKFLQFIAGTEFEATLRRLSHNRDPESWNILSNSRHFQTLTSYQKTWLESVLTRQELIGPGVLVAKGQCLEKMYIIREGEVLVKDSERVIAKMGQGDFIGQLYDVDKEVYSPYSFIYQTNISLYVLYVIEKKDLISFANLNPGLILKFRLDLLNQGEASYA